MCWMSWDQSNEPFSSEMLNYINKINIIEDIKSLSQNIKIKDKCLKNMRIANIVLKLGAAKGLTLNQIGCIIYRTGLDEKPSILESIIQRTSQINKLFVKGMDKILFIT